MGWEELSKFNDRSGLQVRGNAWLNRPPCNLRDNAGGRKAGEPAAGEAVILELTKLR